MFGPRFTAVFITLLRSIGAFAVVFVTALYQRPEWIEQFVLAFSWLSLCLMLWEVTMLFFPLAIPRIPPRPWREQIAFPASLALFLPVLYRLRLAWSREHFFTLLIIFALRGASEALELKRWPRAAVLGRWTSIILTSYLGFFTVPALWPPTAILFCAALCFPCAAVELALQRIDDPVLKRPVLPPILIILACGAISALVADGVLPQPFLLTGLSLLLVLPMFFRAQARSEETAGRTAALVTTGTLVLFLAMLAAAPYVSL